MPVAIGTDEAVRLHREGAQFVDVLGKTEYAEAHLPGAVHIPLRKLDREAPQLLDRRRPVVVYCFDYQWDQSPRAACRLETLGFDEVYDYVPGKAAWLAMDLPVEGERGREVRAGAVADRTPATRGLADRIAGVAPGDLCVVIHDGTVVGTFEGDAGGDADATAEKVMSPGPSTFRPSVPKEELAAWLDEHDVTRTVLTTLDGRLVGVVRREDLGP